jgi:hypothetical protein
MKTKIIVSPLSFISLLPVQSQESKKRVPMTIIENVVKKSPGEKFDSSMRRHNIMLNLKYTIPVEGNVIHRHKEIHT